MLLETRDGRTIRASLDLLGRSLVMGEMCRVGEDSKDEDFVIPVHGIDGYWLSCWHRQLSLPRSHRKKKPAVCLTNRREVLANNCQCQFKLKRWRPPNEIETTSLQQSRAQRVVSADSLRKPKPKARLRQHTQKIPINRNRRWLYGKSKGYQKPTTEKNGGKK